MSPSDDPQAITSLSSDDERYLVINGRRWRRSNPNIPENLRQELVHELMRARRQLVAPISKAAEKRARAAVHDAKVALGERGHPWWIDPTEEGDNQRIAAALRALLRSRTNGPAYSTEIAQIVRSTSPHAISEAVHRVALGMQNEGLLKIRTQKRTPNDVFPSPTYYVAAEELLDSDKPSNRRRNNVRHDRDSRPASPTPKIGDRETKRELVSETQADRPDT
jgi:hypothetical protein